jgi:hypothetical protein
MLFLLGSQTFLKPEKIETIKFFLPRPKKSEAHYVYQNRTKLFAVLKLQTSPRIFNSIQLIRAK